MKSIEEAAKQPIDLELLIASTSAMMAIIEQTERKAYKESLTYKGLVKHKNTLERMLQSQLADASKEEPKGLEELREKFEKDLKKEIAEETESYKIRKSVLKKVQENKKKTGFPIQRFIEDAIEEKLLHEKEYQKLRTKN